MVLTASVPTETAPAILEIGLVRIGKRPVD